MSGEALPRRSGRKRTAPTRMDAAPTRMDAAPKRKRARGDDVVPGPRAVPTPPSPLSIVDEDDCRELFSKALRSVVTVVFDMHIGETTVTKYRTGFILVAEEKYSLILTTSRPHADGPVDSYFVYFGKGMPKTDAYEFEIIDDSDLLILIVQHGERHGERQAVAVDLCCDPLSYDVIFTVCASSDTKLNDKVEAPLIEEFKGSLGIYKGTVGTPCCDALDASYRYIVGSGKYFQVGCSLHDDIITLNNVDAPRHPAEIAVAAPVFRLDGKTVGMLFSDGGWIDSKIGLLAKSIISCMETHYKSAEWKESMKKAAKDWLETKDIEDNSM